MPNIKSAKKRMRQNIKRKIRNNGVKSEIKTLAKRIEEIISQNKSDAVKENLSFFYKKVDKAVSKGILKKNTGARKKSRIAQKIKKAFVQQPAQETLPN